ncbi:MAG: transposase [Pirellulales bacterium]
MPQKHTHRRNFNLQGHAHELTFSCYQRLQFLRAERTCNWLLESLEAARRDRGFAVWAYVIMPEHAHILIWPRSSKYNISEIRRVIKEPVGRNAIAFLKENSPQWLARVTRQRGSKTERLFWQSGGGYDRNIESPQALQAVIEYIHLNPIRRGLVQSAQEWHWSSAAHYAGGTSPLIPDSIPADWIG